MTVEAYLNMLGPNAKLVLFLDPQYNIGGLTGGLGGLWTLSDSERTVKCMLT